MSHARNRQIIAFWRPTDPWGFMGQWYTNVDFVLTEEIQQNLLEEITNLGLLQHRVDVVNKLAEQVHFTTAEKFMMMGKAALFRDQDVFDQMADTESPKDQKRLGRRVSGFDEDTWDTYSQDIVKLGNYLKFSQNPDIKHRLLETDNSILVEGSPIDKI